MGKRSARAPVVKPGRRHLRVLAALRQKPLVPGGGDYRVGAGHNLRRVNLVLTFAPNRRATAVLLAVGLVVGAGALAQAETVEDVTVMNGARAVPATVVIPDGEGPFPAVVMNHGHG